VLSNFSVTEKSELEKALAADLAPPSPEQQQAAQKAQQMQEHAQQVAVDEVASKAEKNRADAQSKLMNAATQAEAVGVNKVKALVDVHKNTTS